MDGGNITIMSRRVYLIFGDIEDKLDVALMRINIWIILAFLLALFAITRLSQYQHERQRICADDPRASECQR